MFGSTSLILSSKLTVSKGLFAPADPLLTIVLVGSEFGGCYRARVLFVLVTYSVDHDSFLLELKIKRNR